MSSNCLSVWLAAVLSLACLPAIAQDSPAPADAVLTAEQGVSDTQTDQRLRLRELTEQLADKQTYEAALEEMMAISGDDVEAIFQHIANRNIAYWQDQLVYQFESKDADGNKIIDVYSLFTLEPEEDQPHSTQPIAVQVDSGDFKRFREYRKARKPILTALAVVGLYHPNDTKRQAATKRVGDRREASAIEKLSDLKDNDPVAKIRFLAEESYYLITVAGNHPEATDEDFLAAVVGLGQLKSIRGLDLLKETMAQEGQSKAIITACEQAIARIDRHQTITEWASHLFRGFSLGTILILMALGLAITFGLMGVINMAHGEMLMIGAIATWATYEFIGTNLPQAYFNWYYVIAFPIAFGVAAFVGWLTEVLIVRHLYKRPLDSLLATIGVSLILIQGVRLWKGDNLGMSSPDWFSGGWEIYQDVVLPYNRLFLIGLCGFCLLAITILFRFTRMGLMMRATVQNREMAQALGVNTRRVDQFTFAFGAGLAGLAGYGLVLMTNPTPQMGQGYIVQSFLTTVVGGVGKLIGVIYAGLGLGFLEKLIEPLELITNPIKIFDAGWAKVAVIFTVVIFMLNRPGGLFPDKGRAAKNEAGGEMPWLAKGGGSPIKRDVILGAVLLLITGLLIPLMYASGQMDPSTLNKLGQYLTFAIMAIGLDLVWGYVGALSLCQSLFFALGGYCMGFYLINNGPLDADGIPECLAYVMSDAVADGAATKKPPAYLALFHSFPVTIILGLLITGLVAFLIGAATFKCRVKGVYFSILTQAIIVAFWNVFVKNDMKLGGTDGLTQFTEILGFQISDKPFPEDGDPGYFGVALKQTRFWLYMTTVFCLFGAIAIARFIVSSRFGRVMVAIRDDETRLRFMGYQAWIHQATVFVIGALFAAVAGMLYVPQKGIITPKSMETYNSILVVVWVALGGRATIWGPVLGAISISILYDAMTSTMSDRWMLVLGATFVAVPLTLPGGLMSIPGEAINRFRVNAGQSSSGNAKAGLIALIAISSIWLYLVFAPTVPVLLSSSGIVTKVTVGVVSLTLALLAVGGLLARPLSLMLMQCILGGLIIFEASGLPPLVISGSWLPAAISLALIAVLSVMCVGLSKSQSIAAYLAERQQTTTTKQSEVMA